MRWQALLREMALEAAAEEDRTRWAQVAEVSRAERAAVQLADRIAASDRSVRVTLVGGDVLVGRPAEVGSGWFALADGAREHLVHVPAVTMVLGAALVTGAPSDGPRLGIAHALRAVARDRAPVLVRHASGVLLGRVDQVGADHLLLTPVGESERPQGEPVLVPFAALRAVSSR